jgi:hypothetical protein
MRLRHLMPSCSYYLQRPSSLPLVHSNHNGTCLPPTETGPDSVGLLLEDSPSPFSGILLAVQDPVKMLSSL